MTTNANTGPSREAVAEAVQRLQAELTANAAAFGAILEEELPVTPASQMREATSQGQWVTLADRAATRLGGGPQVVEIIADSYEAAETAAESARRSGRGATVYRPDCGHSVNRYVFRADFCQECAREAARTIPTPQES